MTVPHTGDDSKPKDVPWRDFEAEVADDIRDRIAHLEWGIVPQSSIVIPRCKLYSPARASDITFDVVVKSFAKASSTVPVLTWVWECKNYMSHSVPVDDVEEFHSKIGQVGAHKGTIVTRRGFQEGAISFAKSHGIGLMTLNKRELIVLAMSASPSDLQTEIVSEYCLYTSGKVVEGPPLEAILGYEMQLPA